MFAVGHRTTVAIFALGALLCLVRDNVDLKSKNKTNQFITRKATKAIFSSYVFSLLTAIKPFLT